MGRRLNIGVIGDGGAQRGSLVFRHGHELGKALVDSGYRLVTGGLRGVMEAACQGAQTSRRHRPGDVIGILPGRDPSVANPFVDVAIPTGLDHLRNSIVAQSDAVVAIGGGAGTLSEICFAWIYKRLIVALGENGWAGKLAGAPLDHRKRFPAGIADDRIYGAATAKEAVALLRKLLPLYSRHADQRRSRPRRKGKP